MGTHAGQNYRRQTDPESRLEAVAVGDIRLERVNAGNDDAR
jgi:hypothetical protein